MSAVLRCFSPACRREFPITEVLYTCPDCGSLLEAAYDFSHASSLRVCFRNRRLSADPLDASGVWRYREMLPFLEDYGLVVTLREGQG